MGSGIRKQQSSNQSGRRTYWPVATNRDTDHWIVWPWPERTSLSHAIEDVHRMLRKIDPEELRALVGDDEVTFLVDSCYPNDLASSEFVWSCTWSGSAGPNFASAAA
jgi:hypothetical protein